MIQQKKIRNFQIQSLYDYFSKLITKEGETPAYSLFIYNNFNLLGEHMSNISKKMIEIENMDKEKIEKYKIKEKEIVNRCADRDENNDIIGKDGQPVITEMYLEFTEEMTRLKAEFPDIDVLFSKINEEKNKFLQEEVVVHLDCLNINSFINSAPPYVVGLCVV